MAGGPRTEFGPLSRITSSMNSMLAQAKMRYPVIWALLLLAVSVDCQRKLAQAPAAPEVTLSVVGNTCEHVVVTPYQMVAEQMISFRQATSRCKMQRRMQIPTLPK